MKRIVLDKKFQRKLINKAKNKEHLTWKELSNKLEVSEGYLRNELRSGKRTLSMGIFERLCEILGENYSGNIIKTLNENWGQSKGGQKSKPVPRKVKLLVKEPSEELAEIFGIMFGDGNIWSRRGYYYVRVIGDSIKDKDYLLNFVKPLFKRVFNIEMYSRYTPGNTIVLQKGSKNLVYTFKKFGFLPGNKKKNNLSIPKWILLRNEYIMAFVRGLVDTDGCLMPKTSKHPYPSIWIKSAIPSLRASLEIGFNLLKFNPSKWANSSSVPQCCLGRSKEVIRFYKEIGFNNPRHKNRFKKSCKAPVV